MSSALCPCGSGAPEAACCAPLHAGAAAPSALALMRSRYTAYVRGAIAYLVETHAAETRSSVDAAAVARWSRETVWQGLEIVATERGGETDDTGFVEFIARGITNGVPFAQQERSRFKRSEGRWYYLDGVARAKAAQVGRNEPCPCGSGKKHKKCHGQS